ISQEKSSRWRGHHRQHAWTRALPGEGVGGRRPPLQECTQHACCYRNEVTAVAVTLSGIRLAVGFTFFLALLLAAIWVRAISAASSTLHLRMFAAAHLGVAHLHLLLMLAAATHTHHLLLVMLRIHLLLMTHHLLIRAMLAFTDACLVGS